ncbi:MAG: selenocysteine-specific translation elongation factor [bacterium]
MKRIILGTAGHIDHGKTTFIKALTGIDCDRLKEEKERGITIELGYAKLLLPSGIKVGIVDVPGHEKFVSKMVAGAAGIDVVALIIAADEGIKPQTREHLYICDLLGIKKGIVVLTKKDLVDAELLELQKEDVREFIKNSNLKEAPIIAVSSTTGEGLDDFLKTLDIIAKEVVEKPVDMPFRMPIDAVLTIKGFGTVVRGTVISGKIKQGEEVLILPKGLNVRVRGLQSHGETISEGLAGERVAINFSDIEKERLERGMVVVSKGYFSPTQSILTELHYLPYNEKPLKSRFNCQFHIFTSRVNAEVFLLNKVKLLPNERAFAMVKLEKPVVVSHGDQFVIRGYGIYTTIGGGRILNPHIPNFQRKYFTEDYLNNISAGDVKKAISIFVKESGDAGVTLETLAGLVKEDTAKLKSIIESLLKDNTLVGDEKRRYYHRELVDDFIRKLLAIINNFHRENPLKLGINKDELMTKAGVSENFFSFLLNNILFGEKVTIKGDLVSDVNFKVESSASGIFGEIEKIYNSYGLSPEPPDVIAKNLKMDIKKLKEALATLVKQGRLQKVSENYFISTETLESVKLKLLDFFSKKSVLTPQDMRDLFGISRKYIIPFLEFLDSIKFTIRVAEGRKLRK